MKRTALFSVILLLVISQTACTFAKPDPTEKPTVEITSGAAKIDIISDNRLYSEPLISIIDSTNTDDLPYVNLGSNVEVRFKGIIPDRFELNDQIYLPDWVQIQSSSTPVDYKTVNGSFVLIINPGTFSGETPVLDDTSKAIRGIILTCWFGEKSYAYVFIFRTGSINNF